MRSDKMLGEGANFSLAASRFDCFVPVGLEAVAHTRFPRLARFHTTKKSKLSPSGRRDGGNRCHDRIVAGSLGKMDKIDTTLFHSNGLIFLFHPFQGRSASEVQHDVLDQNHKFGSKTPLPPPRAAVTKRSSHRACIL